MIVYRDWFDKKGRYHWEGWFLFGILPLYCKRSRY